MTNPSENTIYFYSMTDEYPEFSNFAPYGVEFDDRWWPTVEHYYQAMKFHEDDYRERIRNCGKPEDAKAYGNTRQIPMRSDWEKIKYQTMLDAVRYKFKTHEHPRNILLSTGQAHLAENSPVDGYWGVGPDGNGLNRLGQILMKIREELQDS
ncbi:Swarming motility protein YbiA [Pseudovibrio axinellae]|uniref:Swarming motility protein YbiA n=1 Tax=Pseudovibrio axinellae TaxID=989403 RepID=A0A166A3D2_9HYPH|nr:NADAR family protein [Pseudovibrio axinellae]KZL20585.1 Swarming motility protein YbiA [Pseudovibrio axinellae]SER28587.1 hypothetical protein SAMN05421798_107306 [Pseudovibrio axinellae]